MAPEIMSNKSYNYKVDIWSIGIILFEMLTGFVPFTGVTKEDLKKNIQMGYYRIPKELNLSESCIQFFHKCI